jgi:hypothetical protein
VIFFSLFESSKGAKDKPDLAGDEIRRPENERRIEASYRILPMFVRPVASYTVEAPKNGLIELGPGWNLRA